MLTTLRENRSLTFYQATRQVAAHKSTIANVGGSASVVISETSLHTLSTTNNYNAQLRKFLDLFKAERDRINQKVANGLANNPDYADARNDGVSLARKYEQADIEMGGKGSGNWDKQQQNEILENGNVRGSEGHHINNVSDHPEQQGNPDNIKFYKNRKDHIQDGHGGDVHNESQGDLIDKDRMLKKTNSRRVTKNELRGLGIAAAIGLGVGFTIGFAVTLAQSGVTPESLKLAMVEGIKGGAEAGFLSVAGYGISRTLGEVVTNAVTGVLDKIGLTITENIVKISNMAACGILTIAVFSVWQFAKLKRSGVGTREALIKVGKQAAFSLTILAVSIAAQGIWGGAAGIIVSVSIGIIMITYSVADTAHSKAIAEKVRVSMINRCQPYLPAS